MDSRTVTGIVSSARRTAGADTVYTVVGERAHEVRSNLEIALMSKVALTGGESGWSISEIGSATSAEYESSLEKLVDMDGMRFRADAIRMDDDRYGKVVSRMLGAMTGAAGDRARAFVSGAPVVVRFHNDGDGSSGATALYRALQKLQMAVFGGERGVAWHMNRSVSYMDDALYEDMAIIDQYLSVEKPVIVIIDFGTTEESGDALRKLAEVASIIQVDHHPRYSGFGDGHIRSYINPWDFGGNSDIAAGMLAGYFAQVIADVDVGLLEKASLISDCSAYAGPQESDAGKLALVLDFLTSGKRGGPAVTPKTIEAVIQDGARLSETYSYAKSSLEEAMDAAMRNLKEFSGRGGLRVFALDFGCVSDLGLSYPLPGRFSSKLQDMLEESNGGNTATLVYYSSYISVRLSGDVVDAVDILGTIERLKGSPDLEISGGGHREAAGIKSGRDSIRAVVNALLAELGVKGHGIQE